MADVEDLMDRGPRLKRAVICLVIGLACAVPVHVALYDLAQPDTAATTGADKFVWYFTGLAFVVPLVVAWTLLTRRARAQWLRERIPEAKVR
jgi:hypothetical protein